MEINRPRVDVTNHRPTAQKVPLKKVLFVLLIIILVAGGAGAYWYRDKKAKDDQKKQQSELSQMQLKVSDLEKQLATAKAAATETKQQTTTSVKPSQATIDNIKASISSGNTAALEGYMAPQVRVVIAASEGIGDRTPAQAVGDITDYLKNANSPWDFALPATTLTKYSTGDYAQYFPSTAVVGKAANSYVISFSFDANGKINKVFMAVNDSLL